MMDIHHLLGSLTTVIQSRGPRGRGSRAFNEGLNYKTRRAVSRAIASNAIGLHPLPRRAETAHPARPHKITARETPSSSRTLPNAKGAKNAMPKL
jgi:hypothetical protein